MAIFSAFNNLTSALSSATGAFSSVSSAVSKVSSGLNAALSNPASSFLQASGLNSIISQTQNILAGIEKNPFNVGTSVRMAQNALQGIQKGANPTGKKTASATVSANAASNRTDSSEVNDWRVSLSVPTEISNTTIFKPLSDIGNRMVFPFNPTVMLQHSANYTDVSPVHSNYPFHAYQNSKVDDITLMGEFFVENASDAAYWIACIHFLRTMTKMFYGNGSNVGNPPLVSHLNGYGKYVLNDIPVVIKNFQVELGSDIDYIPVKVPGDENLNYVPTQSTITVTTSPNYARKTVSKFNLKSFSEGNFVGANKEGFV